MLTTQTIHLSALCCCRQDRVAFLSTRWSPPTTKLGRLLYALLRPQVCNVLLHQIFVALGNGCLQEVSLADSGTG